ncbi:hypothetical protein ACS0TY_016228 [Phlomoides rotata]
MRIPCCHTFLAFTLKFLNFLQAFVGVVVIVYSAYVLSKWNDLDASRPAPWFAYASMGIGILVFCISFIGHIGTEAMSGCCLCFYAILSTLFVLLEVGLVAFITLDHHWQEDILPDPTGELDNLRTFIQENMDVFEWIGIVILTIQVLSLLLAVILRSLVSSQKVDDDIEVDYGYNRSNREPLLTSHSSPAPALNRGDSDIWSSRMREKYGLSSGDLKHNLLDRHTSAEAVK